MRNIAGEARIMIEEQRGRANWWRHRYAKEKENNKRLRSQFHSKVREIYQLFKDIDKEG